MYQGPSTIGGKSKSSNHPGQVTATGPTTAIQASSTPPASTVTQQPVVQQHQQPPPQHYTYAPAHQTYAIPMFQMLGNPHQPHHPHAHPHGINNPQAGAAGQQGGSLSIDPNLSAMSDAGEGLSEDEDGVEAVVGGAGSTAPGVKQGPPSNSAGNNGISQQPPSLDEDDYPQHGDQGDGVGQGGPGDLSMEMHTVLDENGQPVKKKRRRQALSCTECKRRKIKCDRQNPCNPCTRRGEADRCHWVTQEPIEKFVTRGEYEVLQSRVAQLEAVIAAIAPRTFIPGLEHLNLPLGPPPFGFHPQHHPYPPGQGPPEGHYHPGEVPPPPPVASLQDLHRAYQQQLQAYANATAQVQAPKPQEVMEVDTNQTQGQLRPVIPVQEEQVKEKPAKGRKRKDRAEGEEGAEEGKTPGKARGKGRASKAAQHEANLAALVDTEARPADEGIAGQ